MSGKVGPRSLAQPEWSFYHHFIAYSTTVIDGAGNAYIATTSGKVYSLSPDGEERWTRQLQPDPANPVLWNGTLFVASNVGEWYALDEDTGSTLWKRKVTGGASPGNAAMTVVDGLVVHSQKQGEGGELIACDAASGEEVWKLSVDAPFFNVMPAVADAGAALVFTDMDGGVRKVEARTGKEIWVQPGFPFQMSKRQKMSHAPRSHSSLALVADGVVYSAGNPTPSSGRVRALRLDTGEELWRQDLPLMMGNAAALVDAGGLRRLVFGTGITALHPIPESKPPFKGTLYALDAATGAKLWSFEAEPMLTNVCPGSVTYTMCPQFNLPDSWSAPAVDGAGTVYVGWQGGVVYAIDGQSGQLVSLFNATEGIQAQPAIGPRGELVVTTGMHTHRWRGSEEL